MTLTQYSGQLAARITLTRRAAGNPRGQGAGGEIGLQRIGPLTSTAGTTNLCYYDPDTDTIYYDTGYPVISQE